MEIQQQETMSFPTRWGWLHGSSKVVIFDHKSYIIIDSLNAFVYKLFCSSLLTDTSIGVFQESQTNIDECLLVLTFLNKGLPLLFFYYFCFYSYFDVWSLIHCIILICATHWTYFFIGSLLPNIRSCSCAIKLSSKFWLLSVFSLP